MEAAAKKRKFSFEDIFTNEMHIKILIIVASKRRSGTSKKAKLKQAEDFKYLKKRTRVTDATLKNYIHALTTSGLVKELKNEEGETVYRFNFESEKGKALKKLFTLFRARDD